VNHRELLEKIGDSRTMSLLYRVSVLYKKIEDKEYLSRLS
jgi:hypothetical protein